MVYDTFKIGIHRKQRDTGTVHVQRTEYQSAVGVLGCPEGGEEHIGCSNGPVSMGIVVRSLQSKKLFAILDKGGVAVVPTDTIYGIVGSAFSKATVERVYRLRTRAPKKPCIILIADMSDLNLFSIRPPKRIQSVLSAVWPGPFSVIFPCKGKRFEYLHRGTHTLAVRLPRNEPLRTLIRKVGPLIAPSANPQDLSPARSIRQAKKYFGHEVECYVDAGIQKTKASTLLSLTEKGMVVARDSGHAIPKALKSRLAP